MHVEHTRLRELKAVAGDEAGGREGHSNSSIAKDIEAQKLFQRTSSKMHPDRGT